MLGKWNLLKQEPTLNELLIVLDSARQDARHSEMVTQTRLYNFLFGDSIVILAWATIFVASNRPHYAALVLLMLAFLSFILAVLYGILGNRGDKFIRMQFRVISNIEAKIPKHLRTTRHTVMLQRGEPYDDSDENPIELSWIEKSTVVGHHLLWLVPYSFAVVSAVLFYISFDPLPNRPLPLASASHLLYTPPLRSGCGRGRPLRPMPDVRRPGDPRQASGTPRPARPAA
jgi:hypothetical protein